MDIPVEKFNELKQKLDGDLYTDNVQRVLYSTDASQYREIPLAVTRPRHKADIANIMQFARENHTSVIPRGAGTSLAGQVVGNGIVVDISKYMNKILDFNSDEKWIWVEPGVVLAELNIFLAKYNLQFGPETSTANRCVIGGMLGNNSCGLHSLVYGSVREHLLEVEALLADGSEVVFRTLTPGEFNAKCSGGNTNLLERQIYSHMRDVLSHPANQDEIRNNFPDKRVARRNMGYAIDYLLETDLFSNTGTPFNFCKLLAGSEGTLVFATRIKLNLVPMPPKFKGLVCVHFHTLEESLEGNLVALKHLPTAIELMDDTILECTRHNIEQQKNRFFVQGEPGAILMIEFACETGQELKNKADALTHDLMAKGLGYHFPLVTGAENIKKVWALRTAGLGVLANIPGDRKGVPGIEDTAVAPELLPDYIADFKKIIADLGLTSVYYAHIATGEIHFRPLINFKDSSDVAIFEKLMDEVAKLVKKYKGSMSGEHGDGRVRGQFIPYMFGDHIYTLFKELKNTWDPENILNPGKIVNTPPITENLRVIPGKNWGETETLFNFSGTNGYFRAIEKCNGSGDCRKSEVIGATMCPTFMATRDEDKSTRGRANILREFLYRGNGEKIFDQEEIYHILSLCISCKACKSECPSNIDMAKIKAEFLQKYYDINGTPLRSKLVAYLPVINKLASLIPDISNQVMNLSLFRSLIGFSTKRKLPPLSKITLEKWVGKGIPAVAENSKKRVYLFNDEFTNFNESEIGIKAILLLTRLGYDVKIPFHYESGRTYLSKGLVRQAKKIATQNVSVLSEIITGDSPLIGIEPSAILAFRDEYPELVDPNLEQKAIRLASNVYLFDEFIATEIEANNIHPGNFTTEKREILVHGHCQQKAVASTLPMIKMLGLPVNYSVSEIPSGCCGMAGSFGYEKEHYELSVKIGEMKLFPAVRQAHTDTVICAPGTSCRHHINDCTGRKVKHPIEVLFEALK